MEKKNNQMVDKEKELKNVAPDTDVAPDVTDASSFQGGPSHTSSNRQQMRLINRIDYYKWKINLLTELISVERENLEKSRASIISLISDNFNGSSFYWSHCNNHYGCSGNP